MIKDVEVRQTKNKGKGLFSLKNFKRGDLLFRSKKPKLVCLSEVRNLPIEKHEHINQIEKDVFEVQSAPECYMNHSCNPNVIMKGRSVFAFKSVKKGEEITVDYRINALNEGWSTKCLCKSSNCCGIIKGDFFTMSKQLQKKYLPYSPKFIKDEYSKRMVESK